MSMKGRKHTPQTRAKISESQRKQAERKRQGLPRKFTHFTPTRKRNLQKKINNMSNDGYSDAEIARKLKIGRRALHRLKSAMSSWEENVDDLYTHKGNRHYAKHERLRNAYVVLRTGLPIVNAAWLFGRSRATIHNWINEYNECKEKQKQESQ